MQLVVESIAENETGHRCIGEGGLDEATVGSRVMPLLLSQRDDDCRRPNTILGRPWESGGTAHDCCIATFASQRQRRAAQLSEFPLCKQPKERIGKIPRPPTHTSLLYPEYHGAAAPPSPHAPASLSGLGNLLDLGHGRLEVRLRSLQVAHEHLEALGFRAHLLHARRDLLHRVVAAALL